MGPHNKKTTFPAEYIHTLKKKNIFKQKIPKNDLPFQNGRQNTYISFRGISILAKIWKSTFPKEFFNEIWFIIGEYEYIYNTEIKIDKFYSCASLGAKQFLPTPKNANLC